MRLQSLYIIETFFVVPLSLLFTSTGIVVDVTTTVDACPALGAIWNGRSGMTSRQITAFIERNKGIQQKHTSTQLLVPVPTSRHFVIPIYTFMLYIYIYINSHEISNITIPWSYSNDDRYKHLPNWHRHRLAVCHPYCNKRYSTDNQH